MIAALVGSPVIKMSIVFSLLLSALANLGDCQQTAGGTCEVDDAVPTSGGALLQVPAKHTAPQKPHPKEKRSAQSMMQPGVDDEKSAGLDVFTRLESFGGHAKAHRGDGLPADTKKLFDEKLCKAKPAQSTPQSPESNDPFDESEKMSNTNGKEKDDPFEESTKISDANEEMSPGKTDPVKEFGRLSNTNGKMPPGKSDTVKESGKVSSANGKMPREKNGPFQESRIASNTKGKMPQQKNDPFNDNKSMLLTKQSITKSLKDAKPKAKESAFSKASDDLDDDSDTNLQAASASLDQAGFSKVRKLNNAEEMAKYIRRVAGSCNMAVIDEGGLNGAVDWFKNPDDAGATFEKLKTDLFRALLAASREHWVTVKVEKGISAETAPLDLLGYVQVRALRKKKQTIQFVKRMVEEMGIQITDMDGFNGLMAYYSEPDDSESVGKLLSEIKKAAYERRWCEMN